MRWGGIILLLFIVFHILDMTVGTTHVGAFEETTAEHGHVYDNAISGFQHPAVTLAYTLAMGALCLHLFHGIWSMFQTFGRNNHRLTGRLRTLSADDRGRRVHRLPGDALADHARSAARMTHDRPTLDRRRPDHRQQRSRRARSKTRGTPAAST